MHGKVLKIIFGPLDRNIENTKVKNCYWSITNICTLFGNFSEKSIKSQ